MDWKVFWVTFVAIFLAELGDKTQIAALSMTSKTGMPVPVFLGAITALSLVTLLGVFLGATFLEWLPEALIKKAAGVIFIFLGFLMLLGKL
jgi:putative Ca2+/H+ antiporter (TMEM165/GDT1 family)